MSIPAINAKPLTFILYRVKIFKGLGSTFKV